MSASTSSSVPSMVATAMRTRSSTAARSDSFELMWSQCARTFSRSDTSAGGSVSSPGSTGDEDDAAGADAEAASGAPAPRGLCMAATVSHEVHDRPHRRSLGACLGGDRPRSAAEATRLHARRRFLVEDARLPRPRRLQPLSGSIMPSSKHRQKWSVVSQSKRDTISQVLVRTPWYMYTYTHSLTHFLRAVPTPTDRPSTVEARVSHWSVKKDT